MTRWCFRRSDPDRRHSCQLAEWLASFGQLYQATLWNVALMLKRRSVTSIFTIAELTRKPEFFKGLDIMYPSFAPWQTATYSNIAYQLLAYALENITGKKFSDMLRDRVIKPLGLNSTFYEDAPERLGVLPGTLKETYWNVSLGEANP